MTNSDSFENSYTNPQRLIFPADEVKNQWLPMLLDSYYIADKGIHEGIRRKLNQGRTLACAKGCSACCKSHTTIPVYPLEVIGIYWYTIEKLEQKIKTKLKTRLHNSSREKGSLK